MKRTQTILRAGQSNGTERITEDTLQEIMSLWDDQRRAPLTFAGPTTQKDPKAGEVTDLQLTDDGEALEATLWTLDRVDETAAPTFWGDPTVGLAETRRGDRYLHHVALGAMPAEVRKTMEGLPGLELADPMEAGVSFSSSEEHLERHSQRCDRENLLSEM